MLYWMPGRNSRVRSKKEQDLWKHSMLKSLAWDLASRSGFSGQGAGGAARASGGEGGVKWVGGVGEDSRLQLGETKEEVKWPGGLNNTGYHSPIPEWAHLQGATRGARYLPGPLTSSGDHRPPHFSGKSVTQQEPQAATEVPGRETESAGEKGQMKPRGVGVTRSARLSKSGSWREEKWSWWIPLHRGRRQPLISKWRHNCIIIWICRETALWAQDVYC